MPVETEIKLRLPEGPEPARLLLEKRGFRVVSPRQLEADQVYDLPGQDLRNSARLLRLRQSGAPPEIAWKWTVTYKGPPTPGPHKSREEIETMVADGPAFEGILAALGYVPAFRYEKYRTKFRTVPPIPGNHAEITLDETPIGVFLELEGPAYWIDQTAAELGFSPKDYITHSYFVLYGDYRGKRPDAPADMIFQGTIGARHTT